MWKPSEVVPHHRRRAQAVWAVILAGIVAYIAWEAYDVFEDRRHPSTSLTLSDNLYQFPIVMVCLYDEEGCNYTDGQVHECIESALDGNGKAYFDDVLVVNATKSNYDNCIKFDLSAIDVGEGDKEQTTEANIELFWISSDDASPETSYTESVDIYLQAEDESEEDGYISVPYSRNLFSAADHMYDITVLTIGKTVRKSIDGLTSWRTETVYPGISISTTRHTEMNTFFLNDSTSSSSVDLSPYAFGALYLDVTQGRYSLVTVTDIDPFDLGTFLGNIGGFWTNLLVVWGLFFIAAKKDPSPTLKGRNFKKSAKIAKEIAAKTIGSPRSSSVGRRAKVEPGCDAEQGNANIISGIDNQSVCFREDGSVDTSERQSSI